MKLQTEYYCFVKKEDINEIQNKTYHKNIDIVECNWWFLMRDIAPIFYNEDKN